MELSQIRLQIDEVDNELVRLFERRMRLSAEVAEYKRENGLPVLDQKREEQLLDRIEGMSDVELAAHTRKLYATILSLSREYQQEKLDGAEVSK